MMLYRSLRGNFFRPLQLLMGWVLFSALSVTQGASASEQSATQKAAEPRVIVVLGDSLTAGYGIDRAQAYPALLQQRINAEGWNFTVVNAGQSGDTTADGLRRLDWLLQRRIHVLIIALGGNDGLRGINPDATQANLQAMIDHAKRKYPDIRIVLAGMTMAPNMGKDYVSRFQAIYPDLAKRNQVALIPFLLEGVGGRPESNQDDMIHPTAEGQKIVADNVWRVLQPLLVAMVPVH
jgi:acyl-CoA thioesterase I